VTFVPPEPTHWYIDYPGISEVITRPIPERLYDTLQAAVEVAIAVYRDSDLPKVVVCEFPSLRRVASVWGDHATPEVHYRPRRPTRKNT
jgi:hypothetical protein